ncbi:hypothetical protein [Gryllotalpicola protaetiae]|uniref:Uncharacterized protein n=1 Tax=Gryllotalpicola protaetiae TaxID=2419771 RepID=A0A387BR53_9MICO|nr:hypothetical protein [Gryllotalpicola protaetiae]AYG03447.1 hypothetical protein D7I44_07785 [Gryllotalpicola protaetiae]
MSEVDAREKARKLAAIRSRQGGGVAAGTAAAAKPGGLGVSADDIKGLAQPKDDTVGDLKRDVAQAAVQGAVEGAAKGGAHGAVAGAAVKGSLAVLKSKTGRRIILWAVLGPVIASICTFLLLTQIISTAAATAEAGVQSQQSATAETAGFTDDQVSDASDAVSGTRVPWVLALAYARVTGAAMTQAAARQLDAAVSSDHGLDLSLVGYIDLGSDGSLAVDQARTDEVAAVGQIWVAAMVKVGLSNANATQIWNVALAVISGQQNTCPSGTTGATDQDPGSSGNALNSTQTAHAVQIISDIRGLLTDDGQARQASIDALDSAITESGILMQANSTVPDSLNYPHDKVGSDHDSLGFFQMRANGGNWGTVAELMDPHQQVIRYLGGPFRPSDEHSTSPLLDQPGWQDLQPDVASQRVEVSNNPNAYTPHVALAETLVEELWSQATPSTTIQPLVTSMQSTTPSAAAPVTETAPASDDPTTVCSGDSANISTSQQGLAQQIVALEAAGKVTYWSNPDSSIPLKSEVDNIANGTATSDCWLGTGVLEAILVAQHSFGSVQINDLNRTCEHDSTDASIHSAHFIGLAVDFGSLGGETVQGSDARDVALLQILDPMSPKTAWAGQANCRAAAGIKIPLVNITEGDDTCTHQHWQAGSTAGTDPTLDEGQFEQIMTLPVGWAVAGGAGRGPQ